MQLLKKLRLNIFDGIIVTLVILAIGALLWLRTGKQSQWITLRINISNDDMWYEAAPPQWWYVENLAPGAISKNSFGETVAEIINVEIFDIGAYRKRAYVDLRVRGSYDTKRQVYLYNYQPIQIGKSLDLTFGKNNVHGVISYINALPNYTDRTIEVRIPAVSQWVADSYAVGATMTDSQGAVLAKIISVTTTPTTANEITQTTDNGQIKLSNAGYKDISLQLRIKTFRSGNVDFFIDRAAIKIGGIIWFQFPQTAIRGAEITRIIE